MRTGAALTLFVVVGMAAGMVGCTSGGDGAAPTGAITDTTTDTVTDTAAEPVASTTAPMTVAPTTAGPDAADTTLDTTATDTDGAPPATEPPEPSTDELEAEIAAAYDRIYRGYWACLRAPLECDLSWLVEGSPSAEAMQATMQGLADRDRYVGDDDVGYYVIEEIEISPDRTEATVVSCWWSTAVLYTTPADPTRPPGPDNPPTIVNDTPSSGRQLDQMVWAENSWRLSFAELIGDDSRDNQCGRPTL